MTLVRRHYRDLLSVALGGHSRHATPHGLLRLQRSGDLPASILGDLVGGAVTLVSVAIGVPLSILVIAFAWLTFRPLIGGGLILVALVVGYLLWRWRKSRAPAVPAGAPAK